MTHPQALTGLRSPAVGWQYQPVSWSCPVLVLRSVASISKTGNRRCCAGRLRPGLLCDENTSNDYEAEFGKRGGRVSTVLRLRHNPDVRRNGNCVIAPSHECSFTSRAWSAPFERAMTAAAFGFTGDMLFNVQADQDEVGTSPPSVLSPGRLRDGTAFDCHMSSRGRDPSSRH